MRILSIDGGGIRGLIAARILDDIEDKAGVPISQLFDVVVGTSTGGLLALALSAPKAGAEGQPRYTAGELVSFYKEHGPRIFSPVLWRRLLPFVRNAPYRPDNLEAVLHEYFGETTLSQAVVEVAVTAYDIENRYPMVFTRREARALNASKEKIDDYRMKDLARATSAAPTYFPPARIFAEPNRKEERNPKALIDGGVFANNPSVAALVLAIKALATESWPQFVLVSIGTGSCVELYSYHHAKDWGLWNWGKRILPIVFDGVADHSQDQLKELFGPGSPLGRYFRFNQSLPQGLDSLDNASAGQLRRLEAMANRIIAEEREKLEEVVKVLRYGAA